MVRQFDEFFSPSFWRVFDAWPKCVPDAYLLVVLHPNRVRPHKEPLHQQRRLEAARRLSFTKGKNPSFGPNTWIAGKTAKQATIHTVILEYFNIKE